MVRSLAVVAVVAACGGDGSSASGLVVSTSFVVTESTGMGAASHLDVLLNQTVAFEMVFSAPVITHGFAGGCPATEWGQLDLMATATGSSAAAVTTEIFGYLPEWHVRLALCDVVAQSSVQLAADNQMNTGFTIGCIGLPESARVFEDGDHPRWTAFTAPSCTLTILDADTNRVLAARDFQVTIALD